MKIAVVGAGFSGLACAYYLADKLSAKITLYDQQAIGAGASGITSGLLHTFAGPKAKMSWQAEAAMKESLYLLDVASQSLGNSVYTSSGMLRPQVQGLDFSNALDHPDIQWWDPVTCQEKIPELAPFGGIFIQSSITVNCPLYIEGLWRVLKKKNVSFKQQTILSPKDLSGFDYIIFTVGAEQNMLKDVEAPRIECIKGQTLELSWPNEKLLPFAVNAHAQFSQVAPTSVWAGATYERKWTTKEPDEHAEEVIRQKIARFSPSFSKLPLIRIWAGLRAATADKRPFIAHTPPNVFCVGGMGSKGLLYHAFMAKHLLSCISQRESLVPC